ncbi:MAG: hypothetical protein KI786_18880 [Mameliella sp.]|nr:hypothetical protein [Phaeodactylibacter sp.]
MFNFLKKVRHKLIAQGNLNKYMIYALGEILLIFIGISLAITFDNFRENKKSRKTELILLKEMLNDEQRNIQDLQSNLSDYRKAVKGCNYILDKYENQTPNDDSLGIYAYNIRYTPIFQISYSAYNTMNSMGWQVISNDALRKEIIFLYDYYYDALEELAHNRDMPITNDKFMPLYNQHFDVGQRKTLDYEALMKDKTFENVIREVKFIKESVIGFTERRLDRSENLQALIKSEIAKLE